MGQRIRPIRIKESVQRILKSAFQVKYNTITGLHW